MRGAIGRRINNPNQFLNATTPFSLQPSSSFSSGSGRGRGRGSGPSTPFQFTATKPTAPGQPDTDSKPDPPPPGLGHGRGRPPAPSSPSLPSYNSFISSVKASGSGRGRSVSESDRPSQSSESTKQREQPNLSSSIIRPVTDGAGRGKPGDKQPRPPAAVSTPIKEENRHIRPKPRPVTESGSEHGSGRPKMSKEEAVKHAMRVLSQGGEGDEITGDGPGRGGRGRGRGVRGRGRGGRGRRGDDFRRREMEKDDDEEGFASALYLGDNADGEKLAEKLGVENMNKLVEGFEEMSSNVLPSPMEDAYIDALHTNYMVRVSHDLAFLYLVF